MIQKGNKMKTYRGYLIDLDGTMYRGNAKIDSAVRFVNKLATLRIPYLFVTNNSSQTPEQVANKLTNFGVPAKPELVITSSLATASYIRQKSQQASIYMIGETGLETALKNQRLSLVDERDVDYVVIGIDRKLSYEKLAKACLAIRSGATFISTNADKAIPTERGLIPGNGALTAVISASTGVEPTFIGKPERIIIDQALERLQVDKHETIMVGDNYETDIRAGMNAGIDTMLVHTGVTNKSDLQHITKTPTYTVDSLDDWKLP